MPFVTQISQHYELNWDNLHWKCIFLWKEKNCHIHCSPGPLLHSSSGRMVFGSLNPSWSDERFLPRLSGPPFHESSSRLKSKPVCPKGNGGGLKLINGRIAGLASFVSDGEGPGPLAIRGSRGSSRGGPRGSWGCCGDPQLSLRSKKPTVEKHKC